MRALEVIPRQPYKLGFAYAPERAGVAGLGVPRQAPALHLAPGGAPVGPVISHGVVLQPVGADFVAPHPASNLSAAGDGFTLVPLTAPKREDTALNLRRHLGKAVLARATFGLGDNASWDVEGPAGVLVLVPMLAASAGAGEPLKPHLRQIKPRRFLLRQKDGYRHRGRVNPASPFGGRDALEPVPAGLCLPALNRRVNAKREASVAPFVFDSLSAKRRRAAKVTLRQHVDQQSGVFAALGCTDFNVDHAEDSTRKMPLAQAQIQIAQPRWQRGCGPSSPLGNSGRPPC